MLQKTIPFFDYKLFAGQLGDFTPNAKILINTLNLHSFVVAEGDSSFKKALIGSDVLLADGIGAVIGSRFLTGDKIKKIAGADLHQYFLDDTKAKKSKFFYLGSSVNTLEKLKARLSIEYPNIEMCNYSPPYKSSFNDDDNRLMIEAVNAFKPDILFIGMTAPKQEKWASKHKEVLEAKFICTIGAVFDFYAGTVARPSKFWISLGLEWLVRLIREPKRMWRRYLYNGPIFAYMIIAEKFKRKGASKKFIK